MLGFDDVLRLHSLQRVELQAWVEHRWVRPRATEAGLVFDEIDQARITLILELRREFLCDDEALDLVLSLLDQLYATRSMLRRLETALAALPPPLRDEIRARLRDAEEA